jgi:hypothetical protein
MPPATNGVFADKENNQVSDK